MVFGQADVTLYLSVYLDRISQAVSDDLFSKEVDKQCWQDVWFFWRTRSVCYGIGAANTGSIGAVGEMCDFIVVLLQCYVRSMCFSMVECMFWEHTVTHDSRYSGVSAICDGEMEYVPEMNESKILRLLF